MEMSLGKKRGPARATLMGNREAWAKCKPAKIECPSVGDPDSSIVRFVRNSLCVCAFLFLLIDNASCCAEKNCRTIEGKAALRGRRK